MIKDFSELLQGFINEERKKLDEYNIDHPPTIGKMYEGLTSDVLEKTIPAGLNLQIVHGVIHDGNGEMSGEIDCMLVKNTTERIPHTDSYKCHIKDVIAVFEVKKTLNYGDLKDAFEHLKDVLKISSSFIQKNKDSKKYNFNVEAAKKAFSETTGIISPPHEKVKNLGFEKELIYHSFILEQIYPIRIVLGYHGHKTEKGIRGAVLGFLNEYINKKGFGVIHFPQLVVSGEFSIIKMNGFPYSVPMESDYWDFYCSSNSNPALLILELTWTKLNREYNIGNVWGEDLVSEDFQPLIQAKPAQKDDSLGWEYRYYDIKHKFLKGRSSSVEWEPFVANKAQFTVFNILCSEGFDNIRDKEFLDFLKKEGEAPQEFVNTLVNTGLVALNENNLELTTLECACVTLPDGRFVVGENNTGRLTRWVDKEMKKFKAQG